MQESDLYAEHLRSPDLIDVRARFTVDQPPCDVTSFKLTATSDSVETPVTGIATTVVSYTGLPRGLPRCGTKLARLFGAIPEPTRRTCGGWRGQPHPAVARVSCAPRHGVKFAVYLQYNSASASARAYRDNIAAARPRACGTFTNGAGVLSGRLGDFLFTCSSAPNEAAQLAWLDEGARVVGYATGVGEDRDTLLRWWRESG